MDRTKEIISKYCAILLAMIILTSLYTGAVFAAVNNNLPVSAKLNGFSADNANTGYDIRYFYAGNMVNIANGNLYLSEMDISVKAKGFNLQILRSYNSHNNALNGPFGFGWTHNYNILLEEKPDGSVTLYEGDGSAFRFVNIGGGDFVSPEGIYSKLKKNYDGSFVLYIKDGSKYNFASNRLIESITDKNDNKLSFEYTDNKLSSVKDESGLSLSFYYNADNNIQMITDPSGREIHYEYNDEKLIKFIDAMGYSSIYSYTKEGKLESSTDRVDSTLLFFYDQNGMVENIGKTLYNRSGNYHYDNYTLYSFDYGTGPNTVKVTNALGHATIIAVNDKGNPAKIIDASNNFTTMDWDGSMNLVRFNDSKGHSTTYEYDTYGNLLRQIDSEGESKNYAWDTIDSSSKYMCLRTNLENERGYSTIYQYDAKGNLKSITDAAGSSSYMTYDPSGNLITKTDFMGHSTSFVYDPHGNLLSVTDAAGNIISYEYDLIGRLITVTDPNNQKSSMEYDYNDRLIKVTDALGNQEQYEYNAVGTLIKTIDPNGAETSSDSNILGKVNEVVDPLNNKASFEYDKDGNLKKYTDSMGNITTKEYDKIGRVIADTDALGNTTTYTYDPNGNLLTLTDRNGIITSYGYDSLNRLISITDPMGSKTSYSYDPVGNLVAITDANDQITSYTYDALDRLVLITDAVGEMSLFSYDANGNLLEYTNANGHSTLYEYDELNRRIKSISALGYTTYYHYDPASNLIRKTDANGNDINYQYDALNRMTMIDYPDGSHVIREYDTVGNLLKLSSQDYIAELSYDELYRLSSVKKQYGSVIKTINYGYDANGNVISVFVDGESKPTEYQYDQLNRITAIDDQNNELTTYMYDAGGRKISMVRPKGITTNYSYDAANNLHSLVNSKSDGDVVSSYTYSYDLTGNVLSIAEESGDITKYSYDALNRLLRTEYPTGTTTEYTYDPAGNRLSKITGTSSAAYTYDAENRMLTSGGISYTYDNNGNLLDKSDGTVYEYDYENRLTSVTLPDTSLVSYTYSPEDDRLSKTTSVGTIYYVYDREDLIMELDTGSIEQARYTHGPGVDDPISMNRAGVKSYYLANGLGSITSLADEIQNSVATYRYDDFGSILEETGTSMNPYKFTAREHDEDIGLYYYRARYYDSSLGRFLSKDPAGTVFEDNLYVYVENNPATYKDPTGNYYVKGMIESVFWGGLALGTAAWGVAVVAGAIAGSPIIAAVAVIAGLSISLFMAGNFLHSLTFDERDEAAIEIQEMGNSIGKGGLLPLIAACAQTTLEVTYDVSKGETKGKAEDFPQKIERYTLLQDTTLTYHSSVKTGAKSLHDQISVATTMKNWWDFGKKKANGLTESSSYSTAGGSDTSSIDGWIFFSIDVTSAKPEYAPGEKVILTGKITNVGEQQKTIWIGRSFRDSAGEVSKYDSSISLDRNYLNLDVGETGTFTVWWTIPNDAPLGNYEIAINAWKDDDFKYKYDDDLEWKRIFAVTSPNVAPTIISPTTSNPGQAGSFTNPNLIKVEVEVSDTISGNPAAGLLNEDFDFKVGEKEAFSMLFDSSIPGQYSFILFPPLQDMAGVYDLEVDVTGMNSDVETDAVKYYATSNVDIVLVLDRSGSMSGTPIIDAKNAAMKFVDYMRDDDKAGVVSFASSASYDYRLKKLESNEKSIVKNRISSIKATGGTAIGSGLRYALNDLVGYGDSQHPWAIVLLSDGEHNSGEHPYNVLPDIRANNIKVFSIGLGSGADAFLLKDIAVNSGDGGGSYYYAPSSTDLKEIYNQIVGEVTNTQTVCSYSDTIFPAATKRINFPISSSDDEAIISIGWPGSDLDLILFKPDGSIIDPHVAANDQNIQYVEESTYEFYRLTNPDPGEWTMKITAIDVSESGEPFSADVKVSSTLSHSLSADKNQYLQGESPKLSVSISENGIPISGVIVTANVTLPDSSRITLKLYDDGGHGDVSKDDGVYANYFIDTLQTGEYNVDALIVGTTGNAEKFSREAKTAFEVTQGQRLIEMTPEEINVNISASSTILFNGSVSSSTSVSQWVSLSPTSLQGPEGYMIDVSNIIIDPKTVQVSDMTSSDFNVKIQIPSDVKGGLYTGKILATSAAGSDRINLILAITAIENAETVISSGGGGGGGAGATGEKYSNIAYKDVLSEFVMKDDITSYKFEATENAIEYVNFEAFRNWGKISATIEMLYGRSALVDKEAPEKVYRNLNIWIGKSGFSSSDNIKDPVVGFKVEKRWIEEENIDPESIYLCSYSNSEWNKLETHLMDEDESYLHFEASVMDFPSFAIIGSSNDQLVADTLKSISDDSIESELEDWGGGQPISNLQSLTLIVLFAIVLIGTSLLYRKKK